MSVVRRRRSSRFQHSTHGVSCLVALCLQFILLTTAFAQAPETPEPSEPTDAPPVAKPAKVNTAAEPLYLQEPYDEVTLDRANRSLVLQVLPLDLPGRKVPSEPSPTDEIEIRLVERPSQTFALAWQNIEKVRLFEQMVLAETLTFVAAGQLDRAYDAFQLLETKYPKTAGLSEGVQKFLWAEIGVAYKAGRYEEALSRLVELHRRNPERKGLADAYVRTTSKLIDIHVKGQHYLAARTLLENLTQKYPEAAAPLAQKWEGVWSAQAGQLQQQAQANLQAGELRAAQQSIASVLELWPTLDGAQALADVIQQKYPVLTVGVTSPRAAVTSGPTPRISLSDWAAHRVNRLTARGVTEWTAVGPTGGQYNSPLGAMKVNEDRAGLVLTLTAGVRWPKGGSGVSAQAIARSVLSASHSQADWTALLDQQIDEVSVQSLYGLRVHFRRPQLLPLALLSRVPLSVASDTPGERLTYGPYQLDKASGAEVRFVSQPGYPTGGPTQPREVVERTFADGSSALRALRRGAVRAVDRLAPWDVPASGQGVVVVPYALPTVHCLLPNMQRPLIASPAIRKALLCSLDRQGILRQALLGGQAGAGSMVLSGPFPHAISAEDQHGYACDEKIKPCAYDPQLAIMLGATGFVEMARKDPSLAQQFIKTGPTPPTIKLAYPAQHVPRLACQSIVRQWQPLGLNIVLAEVPAGEPLPDDYDLAYVELAMTEPAIDALTLLGPLASQRGASGALAPLLSQLASASDWKQARTALHELHAQIDAETLVLPLWQLVEHAAFSENVHGLPASLSTLYQDIEHWQVDHLRTK